MSTSGRGSGFGWLAVFAVGAFVAYMLFWPTEESVDTAIARGHVRVSVSAADDTQASFTLDVLGAAPDGFTVVIPAGTVLRNGDAGGQWLMTARSVTVGIERGATQVTAAAPTYCLHQFDTPPSLTSSLSIEPESSGGGSETLTATRALARCLDEQLSSDQFGIWLVSDGWLDMDYATVRTSLQQKFREQYERENPGDRDRALKVELQRRFPQLSGERLDDEIRKYDAEHPDDLDRRVADAADAALGHFLYNTHFRLPECVPNLSERRFFTSPRASGDEPVQLLSARTTAPDR